MSFPRFVYYSAAIGGWAALLAWLAAEVLFLGSGRLGGTLETVLTAAVTGAAIGAGLQLVSGMTNPQWRRLLPRALPGLIGGGIGGAVGGLLGTILYSGLGLPRALGWIVMGAGIGSAEGLYEASRRKIRNGLIGGCLGGLVGGSLFDPIAAAGSDLPSRATALVILGLSIGALIGLTHVALKEAWLTVLDGYAPGRQLILAAPVTVLGRGDHLPLPFLGYAGKDLESEHLEISRQPDGTYVLRDRGSRVGTRLNGQPVGDPVVLEDGDVIKLGTNLVRFEHRGRGVARAAASVGPAASGRIAPPPLPPGPPRPAPPPAAGPGPPPIGPVREQTEAESRDRPSPPGGASPTPPTPRIPPPPPPPR